MLVLTVLSNAIEEATRLGHQWVGSEHVLLALLDDSRPSLARNVLHELGLTHHDAEQLFLTSLLDAAPAVRSTLAVGELTCPAPIFYEIQGWIAGFAAATGTSPNAEIALLSLCALRSDAVGGDANADRIMVALGNEGVAVASAHIAAEAPKPVALRRIDVPIDGLANIRRRLLEAGLLVGFNSDAENGQAWVVVEDNNSIALEMIATIVDGRTITDA